PKLGLVKFAKSRNVEGRIMNATIRRNPSGKYFVSILVETEVEPLPKTNQSIGIDVGISNFATLSDGVIYENPRFLRKLEKKIEKYLDDIKKQRTIRNFIMKPKTIKNNV